MCDDDTRTSDKHNLPIKVYPVEDNLQEDIVDTPDKNRKKNIVTKISVEEVLIFQ